MKRRNFIAGLSLSLPVIGSLSLVNSCNTSEKSKLASTEATKNEATPESKVINAMLCMQRAAWEQGVAMQALMEVGADELVILLAHDAVLRQDEQGRFSIINGEKGVTDPGVNGAGVLFAWKKTGNDKYKKAADTMLQYYKTTAPKTKKGILHHVVYAPQVWSDATFMAPPFLALMGDYDEAIKQVDGFRECLWSKEKKMFSHIWDEKKNGFQREAFWGGGNGWNAAGMAQIISTLPPEREADKKKLIGYVVELLDGCLAYMRDDGLFHDVVDDPNSFVETNLGQMLAYCIYTGIKVGWLDTKYREAADKMRQASYTKLDEYGFIQDACSSPMFDRAGTSTEAQAFYLMMEGAYRKLNS